ncbi:T9SS C-terminal target domain-containing protein [Hymenobacter sediminis]|uniref:RICIN domain-containing protein n=1 Tax=Hymenobacter sediminis TaxID=2218621 RepID=UPI000DA6CFC5|nr:RICIN domain-containing protein [Hymenobacter sediminis]RPD45049.1 T9SS C-terminal target domain-containing protein [Hymenobacter sediminis]
MKRLLHRPGPIMAGLVFLSLLGLQPEGVQAQSVGFWMTTGDQSKLLQAQANPSFGANTGTTGTTITVNEGVTYQSIDGFGASMTGSSAYVLNRNMSASQRDALLNDLFTSSGIRLSFLRHTMGGSDFSAQGDFTYDDRPAGQTDPNLTYFNLNNDRVDLIPMLKAARARNSSLKLMGSPWSAPAWMKETGNLRGGGWLNTAWYQAYANYFVKYVQGYAAEGLPVYAVTLQNEPLYAAPYMAMRMDPGNQAAFLKNNIGPAFRNAGITTKLIVYDHNWDRPDYPMDVFADAAAAQYAAGSAFHGYSSPSGIPNQTTVHNAYPNKDIWFTEATGSVGGSFSGDLRYHVGNYLIGTTRNWSKSVLIWNLALDQNSGPKNGGCPDCRGVVTVNNTNGSVTRNVEYYALGHASKFVDPGAVRIESNSVAGGIENVAFRNPDGSKVLIALNNGSAASTFKVVWNGQAFTTSLPAGAVATYKWSGSTTTPSGGPQIGRIYEISSKNGGKALEVSASSQANGGRVQQWGWVSAANQKWKLVDAGGGYVRIVNLNSNKSLDIAGPSTADGALVHQWDWASADNQYWQILSNGDGTYRIINKYSGKALDVQNNSTADGAAIQQWTYGGSDNQRWWFSDQGAARVALATTNAAADARLVVYPTVANTDLNVSYTATGSQRLALRLLDMTGRVLTSQAERPVGSGQNLIKVPVNGVPAGIYLLQVDTPEGQLVRRVIVAH